MIISYVTKQGYPLDYWNVSRWNVRAGDINWQAFLHFLAFAEISVSGFKPE